MRSVAAAADRGVSLGADGEDHRSSLSRLSRLLDAGSLSAVSPTDDSGVRVVRGRVEGQPVIAYCTDATTMGGALGAAGSQEIVTAIDLAVHRRCPVIGLWHSGGARLADGVESMDGVGQMFAAMVRASGRVPQLSVVLGPAAGAAAYGPALTDIVILSAERGRMFVTGPDIVRAVTGEQISQDELGGADVHGRKSGVAHVIAESEQDAYTRARRITSLLARPGHFNLARAAVDQNPRALLPESPRRAYDVRPLIGHLLDAEDHGANVVELQPKWAPNMVIGLGRLAGRTVGVLANNPLRKGGCLDSPSAEKAARFVRMCDSFGVPLVVLVDVPGYLPGTRQEWEGVVRRGAKLLYAFAEALVPRVTLVTRKSYGGAYIAMNSRALGASAVFAWPEAEVAVMDADAAVGVLHQRRLAAVPAEERAPLRALLAAEHRNTAGSVDRGIALGVIDEIIDPAQTRLRLATALASAPAGRGHHGNIPL
jgi:acetyl-CoA/propionyl-CoA carboxylase carboxyl transferase subunit